MTGTLLRTIAALLLLSGAGAAHAQVRVETDPARIKRTDPGDPAKCPVWQLHCVYSDEKKREWVQQGCRSAGIGCLECKQPVIDAVLKEQQPIRERAEEFLADPDAVRAIIDEGCEAARSAARDTLDDVRQVMNLAYR